MKEPWAYNPPQKKHNSRIHIRNPNKGPRFLNQASTLDLHDSQLQGDSDANDYLDPKEPTFLGFLIMFSLYEPWLCWLFEPRGYGIGFEIQDLSLNKLNHRSLFEPLYHSEYRNPWAQGALLLQRFSSELTVTNWPTTLGRISREPKSITELPKTSSRPPCKVAELMVLESLSRQTETFMKVNGSRTLPGLGFSGFRVSGLYLSS